MGGGAPKPSQGACLKHRVGCLPGQLLAGPAVAKQRATLPWLGEAGTQAPVRVPLPHGRCSPLRDRGLRSTPPVPARLPASGELWSDEELEPAVSLDGVVTVVDAANVARQLSEARAGGAPNEAQLQVALADVVLLNKVRSALSVLYPQRWAGEGTIRGSSDPGGQELRSGAGRACIQRASRCAWRGLFQPRLSSQASNPPALLLRPRTVCGPSVLSRST